MAGHPCLHGLCDKQGCLCCVVQMVEKDIGFVGEVTRVDPAVIQVWV